MANRLIGRWQLARKKSALRIVRRSPLSLASCQRPVGLSARSAVADPTLSRSNHGCLVIWVRSRMKAYMCVICGYVYEEEKGDANAGLVPGTKWSDVPLSWRCPDCGAGKEDFEMVEI
jgi:rubredoxin